MTKTQQTSLANHTMSTGVQQATPREVQQWLRSGTAILVDVHEPD